MLLKLIVFAAIVALVFWTVVPTVRAHSSKEQKAAFLKCLAILFISSLPVFVSFGMTDKDKISLDYIFFDLAGSPFSWSEQLVYASTFLAPVIYAVADAFRILSSEESSAKKRHFKRVFKRYWRVLFPALGLLFLSIAVYVLIKTDPDRFKETVFYTYLSDKSILIYITSWIYWYCVVLIDSASGEDYTDASGAQTRSLTDAARIRLEGDAG